VTVYLDTNISIWFSQKDFGRISSTALSHLREDDLLISAMVVLELEYLFELKRILWPAQDLLRKLRHEADVDVCELSLQAVAEAALAEKWTRDPFDRMIVANAKANALSPLITADEKIQANYPRALW
jgi:PIN domain nuclease of toxin-antitoxin system